MELKKILLFLIILFVHLTGRSQNTSFRRLSVEDGLSNNFVRSIYKDHLGFMWFGTLEGIDRFDGVELRNFSNRFPFAEQSVNCISEDTVNYHLWIGTETGLYTWDRYSNLFQPVELPAGAVRISALAFLNSTLVAGSSQGVWIIDVATQKIQHYLFHSSLTNNLNQITGLVLQTDEFIWFSTLGGLVRFNFMNRKHEVFQNEEGNPQSNLFSALTLHQNDIYLGTRERGVIQFNTKTAKFKPFPGIENNYILCISADNQGNLYVGSDGGGLEVIDLQSGEDSLVEHDSSNSGFN